MKGKITKSGYLVIMRRDTVIHCTCPYAADTAGLCGDYCQFFGDPERSFAGREVKLQLCHRTLEFEELEDER